MLNKEEIEKALTWVEERIIYIIQNCDLKDGDNKRALDNFKIINMCLQENNKLNKMINKMAVYIATLDIDEDICSKTQNKHCDKMSLGECEACIKQYFEKKVGKSK